MLFRRLFYFLFSLLFLHLSLAAQTEVPASLTISEEYKIPKNTYFKRVISADQGYVHILRGSYSMSKRLTSVIVESYDIETLKLKRATDIPLKYQKRLRIFHDIFEVNDKFYLITSYFNSAKNKNFLFAQKLNNRFEPDEDLILIGEIDSRSESKIGDFQFDYSRDSSKVIVYHDIPTKRSDQEEFKFSIYNDNFDLLWDKEITFPFESKLYSLIKFAVDNDGNGYLLGKHYFDKIRNKVKGLPNYEYILEVYSNSGENKERYQLMDKQKFISDLTFEVNRGNEIICTGFYTNRLNASRQNVRDNNRESIEGIVYFKIDNNAQKIEEKKFSAFDLDFITLNQSERQRRRSERRQNDDIEDNDPALYSYYFRDIILRSDGGVVIIAEQYFETVYNSNFNNGFDVGFNTFNNGIYREVIEYNYNDIIVVNVNPDGSIRWANAVPKYQSTLQPEVTRYYSFSNANIRDKIYMLFNEDGNVFESQAGFSLNGRALKNKALALAELDKTGELSIYKLGDFETMQTLILPTETRQIAKNELLIYGESKNYFRIGTVLLQ
mgnify:CR=1 FL=1